MFYKVYLLENFVKFTEKHTRISSFLVKLQVVDLQLLENRTLLQSSFLKICKGFRSSASEVFLGKGVLKICCKFTVEHTYRSCFATLLKSHFSMDVLL